MINVLSIEMLIELGRIWYKSVCFMQRQIRNRLHGRETKEYMMDAAWDKLFGKLMNKAIEINDTPIKEMLTKIAKVEPEVKEAACKYYVDRCI